PWRACGAAHICPAAKPRRSPPAAEAGTAQSSSFSVSPLQHRKESFLRNFDRAHLLHALLAFLLLLEQLALAGDVAAVAFGDDILAQRLHVLARNDIGADGRLDGNVEHLPRDQA